MTTPVTTDTPATLTDALRALAAGATTSAELTEAALAAADRDDAVLGVFVSRSPDAARAAARAADEARKAGADLPLLGVPVGVKDIITTEGAETTAQSLVLDRAWATGDATVVARLRAAGAVVVGKTTTMEFAFGTPDADKPFPIPRNPWDLARWTGGSSSGSASGLAAGMFLGALGTDTGASVRMPAALCGITGLKPTFGRVPKSGVVPLGYSLDCVGPMARSAEDCARLLAVLAGPDPADRSAAEVALPELLAGPVGVAGMRIGYDPQHALTAPGRDPAVDELIEAALDVLREQGAEIVPVEVPLYEEVTSAALVATLGEAAAYHAPDLRDRWADYFASTRMGLGMAAFLSAADLVAAQRVRRLGQLAIAELFSRVDAVITPTVARAAPLLEEAGDYIGTLFAGADLAFLTAYWNGLGSPVLSVPVGFSAAGLPLAMQVAGPAFAENTVLRVGAAYQSVTDWHLARPGAAPAEAPAVPAPSAPPLPAASAVDLALLAQAGIGAPDAERVAVAAVAPLVRSHAERLRDVPGLRYVDPATVFRA